MKNPFILLAALASYLLALPANAELIGFWNFEEGAGTTTANAQGNTDLDATFRSTAAWGPGANGSNASLEVDGTNTGGADLDAPITNTFSNLTISGWINPDISPQRDWTGLFGSRGGPQDVGFGFRGNTNQIVYTWNNNNGNTYGYASNLSPVTNEWNFVAVRITPTAATLYLRTAGGDLMSSTNAIAHSSDTGSNWSLGHDNCCGTDRNFEGQMDDFAMWDEALSDEDIEKLSQGISPLALDDQNVGGIALTPALTNPVGAEDLHVLSSASVGTAVGSLQALNAAGAPVPNEGVTYSLVDGAADNALFAIGGENGDRLETAADLSGAGGAVYTVRVKAEDAAGSVEVDLTVTVGADTDTDGLLDAWEEQFSPGDLSVLSAETDTDSDGLTSGEELALGTDPTNPDTDSDGLNDGDEQTAGTDPLDNDSDDDGVLDGAEVNGNPATDPLNPDTDGDGISDGEEKAAGSDPTDPNDPPAFLVGYWPADEGSGILVANAAGDTALDGELMSGSWGAGHTGSAGDFAFEVDGTSASRVQVPPTGRTFDKITITGWVNGAPTGDWTGLIQARAPGQPPIGIGFRGGSGELTYTWNNNNGNTWNFNSGLPVPQNEWAFVALSLEADQATLYLGSTGPGSTLESATNAIPQLVQANDVNHWNFGIDECCGTARNFSGRMDDISIWAGALSEEQITALWDQSKTPLTLFGGGARSSFSIVHSPDTEELVISWDSQDGKLYHVRSETDPSSAEPRDWPIFDTLEDLEATPPVNTVTILKPLDPFRLFVIEEFNAPPVAIFSDDFESGQGDWTSGSDGAEGTAWELGTPSVVGPSAANSPVNCFATNIAGDYDLNADVWLRSPAIDLTTAGGATLNYFQFVDIEEGFDAGRVAVLDAADDSELAVIEEPVDGAGIAWEQVSRALPAAALGKTVRIEFRLTSDELESFSGWYLDDVTVTVP